MTTPTNRDPDHAPGLREVQTECPMPCDSEADRALAALLSWRAAEPARVEFQAYFDAALDALRKEATGLAELSLVALAHAIAMKCQAARKALP